MEMQVCPAFKNLPHAIRLAASLRSAVSSIIQGLFPPSSSEIGVRFSLACFIICLPTAGLPVKKI